MPIKNVNYESIRTLLYGDTAATDQLVTEILNKNSDFLEALVSALHDKKQAELVSFLRADEGNWLSYIISKIADEKYVAAEVKIPALQKVFMIAAALLSDFDNRDLAEDRKLIKYILHNKKHNDLVFKIGLEFLEQADIVNLKKVSINQKNLNLLLEIISNERLIEKLAELAEEHNLKAEEDSEYITMQTMLQQIVSKVCNALLNLETNALDQETRNNLLRAKEIIIAYYERTLRNTLSEINKSIRAIETSPIPQQLEKYLTKLLQYKEQFQNVIEMALESLNLIRSLNGQESTEQFDYQDMYNKLSKSYAKIMFSNTTLNSLQLAEQLFNLDANSLAKYKGKIPEEVKNSLTDYLMQYSDPENALHVIINANALLIKCFGEQAYRSSLFQQNDSLCSNFLKIISSDVSTNELRIMAEQGMYESIKQAMKNKSKFDELTILYILAQLIRNESSIKMPINFNLLNMLLDAYPRRYAPTSSINSLIFSAQATPKPENLPDNLGENLFTSAIMAGDEQTALRILHENMFSVSPRTHLIQFALEHGAFDVAQELNKNHTPDARGATFLENFPIAKEILNLSKDNFKKLFETLPEEYSDNISGKLMLKPMIINGKSEYEIYDYFTLSKPEYLNLDAVSDSKFSESPGNSYKDDIILPLNENPYTKANKEVSAQTNKPLEDTILQHIRSLTPRSTNII